MERINVLDVMFKTTNSFQVKLYDQNKSEL